MILNPLEKTRLSARLLQLRALLQAGTLAPLEKARASAEAIAIRTKLGAAVVPAPGGETADDLAELAQDDGLSDDPNSPNYRYRDTGYIPGSRKEEAARVIREAGASGVMLRASDIDFEAIEQNPREARKLITKSNLFGLVDWAALEEGGMEPAAGFLLDRVYASVGKEPAYSTAESRQHYVMGMESLRTRLEACKTAKEILAVLDEPKDELQGSNLSASEEAQDSELAQQYKQLTEQRGAIEARVSELYQAMQAAVGAARLAKYDMDKRLGRGWAIKPEHEQAVRDTVQAEQEATRVWRNALLATQEERDTLDIQRRVVSGLRRDIRDAARARNLASPACQAWLALGGKFVNVLQFRYRSGSAAFRDHAANALAGDPKTWEWAQKETPTVERKVTKKRRTFALKVIDKFERIGGRPVSVASTLDLERLCGFRAVQTGNWVQKDIDSAKWHVEQAAGALLDMADVLGIDEKALGFGGRLGMAFGARGTGNTGGTTAAATYEPVHRVVNITKMNGGGSFGHENWHALDNILPGILRGEEGEAEEFGSVDAKLLPPGPIRDAFAALNQAMTTGTRRLPEVIKFTDKDRARARYNIDKPHNEVSRKIKAAGSAEAAILAVDQHFKGFSSDHVLKTARSWRKLAAAYYGAEGETAVQVNTGRGVSDFMAEAKNLDASKSKEYWSSGHELAARSFQSYLEDKMEGMGRRNDYLSSLADNRFHYFPELGEPFKPYPEGEERTRINAAFDQLFKALRDEKAFEKALQNNALLDSIFGGIHD